MTEYKNIYQKLHVIQKRINGLGKDKKTYNYSYVTGDKVLEAIKPIMNEVGLLLKQEVISIENTRQDYATKAGQQSEINSKVMMRFTWVDIDTGDKDENLFGANGQNAWDKGVGSALTYGERYFLLKYFHIATDEDDIDNPERKPEEVPNKVPGNEPIKAQPTTTTVPQPESAIEVITEAENTELLQLLSSPFVPQLFREQTIKVLSTWTSADAQTTIKKLKSRIAEKEQEPVTEDQKGELYKLLSEINYEPKVKNVQVDLIGKLKTAKQFYDLKSKYETIVNKLQTA